MTPIQAIQIQILRNVRSSYKSDRRIANYPWPDEIAEENVAELWEDEDEESQLQSFISDEYMEFREGTHAAGYYPTYHPEYKGYAVKALCADRWVRWTYYYGDGGPHDEADIVDWPLTAAFV